MPARRYGMDGAMHLGGDTITFQNYSGTDQWSGKPAPAGDPFTVAGVNCQPLSVSESTQEFTDVKTSLRQVWCPPTAAVQTISVTSTAMYEGRLYQVAGDPQYWRTLGGRLLYVLIRLELIK